MDFSHAQSINVAQDQGYWQVRVVRGEHTLQRYQFVNEQDARRFVWVLNRRQKGHRRST